MGMYTRLKLNVRLDSHKMSYEDRCLLYAMCFGFEIDSKSKYKPNQFSMFWTNSVYFKAWHPPYITPIHRMDAIYKDGSPHYNDDVDWDLFLNVDFNIKNYEFEIQEFLKWIELFVSNVNNDCLGFYICEEQEKPYPVLFKNGEILIDTISV